MLRAGLLPIGRIARIPLKIHFSWFIVFGLVSWMLAVQWYPTQLQNRPVAFYIVLAVISALLLFASVLVHELSHALVARRFGVPVRGIVLFVFGGIAEMVGEPRRPHEEAAVAAAGPAASILISAACWLAVLIVPKGVLQAVVLQLALVNLGLFAFNLIPAFPLDGGRIARATLWAVMGNYRRATFVATLLGVGFAIMLGTAGLYLLIAGGAIGGIWLVFIAFFVGRAAMQAYKRARFTDALRASSVSEVMVPSVPYLGPHLTLEEAETRQPGCLDLGCAVGRGEEAIGYVDPLLVAEIPKGSWDRIRLGDVMLEIENLGVVGPNDPLEALFQVFAMGPAPAALVVEEGRWVGTAGRGALLAYFQRLQA